VLLRPIRRRRRTQVVLEPQPDDLPTSGLFTEPIRIGSLDVLAPESLEDGSQRVVFLVEVKDAEGRRCPALSVTATVTGPERSREVEGSTDLLGRIRFRMTGPAGGYRIEVTDVAAGALRWDRGAGPSTAEVEVG
jgi:hypothetical protein